MTDPRFYPTPALMTLAEIAALTGATVAPLAAARVMRGVAPLELATGDDVSFIAGPKAKGAAETRAGAVFVASAHADLVPATAACLITSTPQVAYARLARHMLPDPAASGQIDPSARVSPLALIGNGVEIGPMAVVGAGAEIGAGTVIGPGAVIGTGVIIGPHGQIGPLASLSHAILGAYVTLHAGARIGTAGFGYLATAEGPQPLPQLGRVLIGDNVEIGANTTIDRGAGDDTVIGNGTKIDNLVMIGHNCRIGQGCLLIGQVGLAGSVTLEDGVILAGQVGVADHITIGRGAMVAAKSGVMTDIPAGAVFSGIPAREHVTFMREIATLKHLTRKRNNRVHGSGT